MTPRRSVLVIATAITALSLAACSSSDTSSAPSEALSAAAATAVPSAQASPPATVDPAQAPYVTTDCAVGQPIPSADAPVGGDQFGSVNVNVGTSGVPTVTIGPDAQPATTLEIDDLVEGTGPAVKAGDTLTVNYCGVGMTSRQMFDSSWSRGEPISFPLDGLIQGWIDGLPGMKVGGQRLLVIPGALGYGPQGQGSILPDETLVFVIELVSIP